MNPLKDALTGLMTRKDFHDLLERALEERRGSEAPVSLAFVDIDNFLRVNETFGHAAGDAVLVALAGRLTEIFGDAGVLTRYGGDEFAVLFPGLEREQAFLLLEKARTAVAAAQIPTMEGGPAVDGLTISAGLACYPLDGRLKSELLRKADQALYRAKLTGRNKVRLAYDEKMVPKTSHFTQTQLERLAKLAAERQAGEAELLREALDDLLAKYGVNEIERWV